VRKDSRIRGYFSTPKGARERKSLEHTRTDVNVEEIKHMFMLCEQKVGLNQTKRLRNVSSENVTKSGHLKKK